VISHRAPSRDKFLSPSTQGAELKSLPNQQKDKPPLNSKEVKEVFGLSMKAEDLFSDPQDVEWTYRRDLLHILQARPITTLSGSDDDQRPWYLSLQRSFENLKILRLKIEQEILPAMEEEAAQLAGKELSLLTDQALADEIEHRLGALKKWQRTYREDCIPFAHGMRLFGQVYNDVMKPKDPFAFMELLRGVDMVSLQRNRKLQDLAARIRSDEALAESLRSKKTEDIDPEFRKALSEVAGQFGDLTWSSERFGQDMTQFLHFLLEMASIPQEKGKPLQQKVEQLEKDFFSRFHRDRRDFAIELLDLARASYRLRDDDNTYLGRIEGQLILAVNEGKSRLQKKIEEGLDRIVAEQMVKVLRGELEFEASATTASLVDEYKNFQLKPRQLLGQPAGPGLSFGSARVVKGASDLFAFQSGEVLVCDAVDPNMTFVVPLAAGIVERRGGMLIHGAIIAREYGLPCVTGVPDAVSLIKTGNPLTVDGFLGIVTVGETRQNGI
jgi:pyruvate,water dikinase